MYSVGGGGVLWFCRRYVVMQTLHHTHENPNWSTSTCYMYIYIGQRIAGTKDEPNLIFEYQPSPPPPPRLAKIAYF